jgi:hypothetical protein
VRLGPGAPVLTDSAEHPFALANPDGSVTLYYGKFAGPGSPVTEGLYESTSADGLTFTQETYDVYFGNDPDVLRLVDGTLVAYYGLFDPAVGGTINVARCTDPAPAGTTPGAGNGSRVSQLLPGGAVSSASGRYRLTYQTDGNLVLYDMVAGTALWLTGTGGSSPGQAILQTDGNFVVYDGAGTPLWQSHTGGNPGGSMILQEDGNLVIYGSNGQAVWNRIEG